MKVKLLWKAIAIALGLAGAVSINVYAAPGGNGGGGGNAGTAAGALYGDLYVIERNGNGEPVLRSKTLDGVTYTCQQPLAAGCSFLPLNFDKENPPFEPKRKTHAPCRPIPPTCCRQSHSGGRAFPVRPPPSSTSRTRKRSSR